MLAYSGIKQSLQDLLLLSVTPSEFPADAVTGYLF